MTFVVTLTYFPCCTKAKNLFIWALCQGPGMYAGVPFWSDFFIFLQSDQTPQKSTESHLETEPSYRIRNPSEQASFDLQHPPEKP
jgi:hypothetical protein